MHEQRHDSEPVHEHAMHACMRAGLGARMRARLWVVHLLRLDDEGRGMSTFQRAFDSRISSLVAAVALGCLDWHIATASSDVMNSHTPSDARMTTWIRACKVGDGRPIRGEAGEVCCGLAPGDTASRRGRRRWASSFSRFLFAEQPRGLPRRSEQPVVTGCRPANNGHSDDGGPTLSLAVIVLVTISGSAVTPTSATPWSPSERDMARPGPMPKPPRHTRAGPYASLARET